MPFYEHVLVARQDLTPNKVAELADKYTAIITENGGKVTKREDWGLRTLAYKIQKNRKGYYALLNIDAPAKAVIEMERLERIDENLLRFLTVKVDVLEATPSVVLEPKYKKSRSDDKFDVEVTEGGM